MKTLTGRNGTEFPESEITRHGSLEAAWAYWSLLFDQYCTDWGSVLNSEAAEESLLSRSLRHADSILSILQYFLWVDSGDIERMGPAYYKAFPVPVTSIGCLDFTGQRT